MIKGLRNLHEVEIVQNERVFCHSRLLAFFLPRSVVALETRRQYFGNQILTISQLAELLPTCARESSRDTLSKTLQIGQRRTRIGRSC
jgi:hypothetical protein